MNDSGRLERIEVKLDDLSDHMADIDVTLKGQHVSLKDHIKRTAMLEDELRPLRAHVTLVNGVFKILVGIATILGVIAEVWLRH